MMQKRTSAAEPTRPMNYVVITLDNVMAGSARRAAAMLEAKNANIHLKLHAASDWAHDNSKLEECRRDIESGDIIVATMLFIDDHIKAVLPWLEARAPHCDAFVGCIAAAEVVKLTRLGKLDMSKEAKGPLAMLKKLRGKSSKGSESNGVKQMSLLRGLPKILRFIPGTSQDLRAYFITMQYWLASSAENMAELGCFLANRYASGDHAYMRGQIKFEAPEEHPDCGVYHPDLVNPITEELSELPKRGDKGTVGLLIMRSYLLAKDTAHYDAAIRALEAKGLNVIPAFASGLDARPAVDAYFKTDGKVHIDAMVSLTGFSLVGGPAYNDSEAASKLLSDMDVPYIAAHAVEFQDMDQWLEDPRGLMPVESTMMVAIPELDGATGPIIFGGRSMDATGSRDMQPAMDRIDLLARRVARMVRLRRKAQSERKLALVLFNFPPNSGATGTAAYLDVFHSLFHTLERLKAEGYKVDDLPDNADTLRRMMLGGNSEKFGTDGNVFARVPVDDHVRNEPYLKDIEAVWGPAPGKILSDGRSVLVMGIQLGNIFIGLQPGFGYEGDPMRLLFESGFAPTHAFTAFYRFLSKTLDADAIVHFGMHGALEFMPGKQVGMSSSCWPDRLIGDMPNIYLYAANNPSEGALAKRRSAATLVTYQTPPLAAAGLYKGLLDLKESLLRWRSLAPDADEERARMISLIYDQAVLVDIAQPSAIGWTADDFAEVDALNAEVLELEYSLIPHGLHIIGEAPNVEGRADLLQAIAEGQGEPIARELAQSIAAGESNHAMLSPINVQLQGDHELDGLTHALDGGFIPPVAGGDVMRSPDVLPTGRNMHGFDPYRLPSAMAMRDGTLQADRLINRYVLENGKVPESVALVLWGTDNLKSEGGPIAQALALLGAKPRFDSYGRLCGAELVPLEELGRPRIDCVITLSGIFRDLLPLQIKLLAEACYLAAVADEPITANMIRAHALEYQDKHGCDIETAALRVFSNGDGAYGANVNQLIDSGSWEEENELAEAYTKRKCFAYGRDGQAAKQGELLDSMLGDVQMAYQNLESVEVGVTTIDHYFDTLGGISRAVKRSKGADIPVFIGDETRGEGKVRSLAEQVTLETRTRMLNPKWYEGMLEHGYEGVRQIEAHVTNTMGWSATTGQVAPWVYKQITQTFILDENMRRRMAEMNPKASARVANRLLEAQERSYWEPDQAMLDALREAGEELEDRVEGITAGAAA